MAQDNSQFGAICAPASRLAAAPRQQALLGNLTDKDREVLDLLVLHHSNKEIAIRLSLAEGTVEARLRGIRTKLPAQGRHDLARRYQGLRDGLRNPLEGFPEVPKSTWADLGGSRIGPEPQPFMLRDATTYGAWPSERERSLWPDPEAVRDMLSPFQTLLVVGGLALFLAGAFLIVVLMVRDVASNGLPGFVT